MVELPPHATRPKAESMESLYLWPLGLLAAMAVGLSVVVAPVVDAVVKTAVVPYYKTAGMAASGMDLSTGVGFIPVWPLFIVLMLVVVPVYLLVRVRTEELRPVYMCGEQAGDVSSAEFRSLLDKKEMSVSRNYYFEKALGERSLNVWANPVAIALLIALVLGVMVK
ncbi:MAG TPA: hypothetical protein VFD42_08585, partial [Chloroflexota bacterium]|nr:hypothetical protein [Chloroflexota bacterium]